jgi:hypothetical protein
MIRGDPRFARTLRCSTRNHHASPFRMGHYCSVEVVGPEAIMTMILELMGCRSYGMLGDSILALLHHHFTISVD